MNPRRRILVVTPTLGESRFLDETVDSVRALPMEIMHVISAPAPRIAALQARFPEARVVPDAGRAGGIYGALNAALAAVPEGWDWFSYINDDDRLLPGFGGACAEGDRSAGPPPVIYGDVQLIEEEGRSLARVTVERDPAWIPALLQQGISPLMQQGMLFPREVVRQLGGFDTRYRLCADLDFWVRAYAQGARFRHYPGDVGQFRIRNGQLSGDTTVTEGEQADIVRRHLPEAVSGVKRQMARWRYRWCNLPRYLSRVRTRGWRTSYQILQGEGGTQ